MQSLLLRQMRRSFRPSAHIEVRRIEQVPKLQQIIRAGPITFILIFADWCGHCVHYKPQWAKFSRLPGRRANIASVHHDMQEHIPELVKAKINGYPSVIKIYPDGHMEKYTMPGESEMTNAMPTMREESVMNDEFISPMPNSREPGPQAGVSTTEGLENKEAIESQRGGGDVHHLARSFRRALGGLGAELRQMLGGRTYRSPKRSNHRGRTRRHR